MICLTKEKQADYGWRKLSLYLFPEVEHVSPGIQSITLTSRIMTSRKSIYVTFLLGDRHHNSVCGKHKAATGTRLVDEPMNNKRFEQCKATRHNKEIISDTPVGVVRWCEKFRASRLHLEKSTVEDRITWISNVPHQNWLRFWEPEQHEIDFLMRGYV